MTITITDAMRDTIGWALHADAENGDRLVDAIDLDEIDLDCGDDTLVPLVTEIITGSEVIDGRAAIDLTVTAAGDITATVDLDELDQIGRASGDLYVIAPLDLVRSLRGRQPVDLAAVAQWLTAPLIHALTETLSMTADDH